MNGTILNREFPLEAMIMCFSDRCQLVQWPWSTSRASMPISESDGVTINGSLDTQQILQSGGPIHRNAKLGPDAVTNAKLADGRGPDRKHYIKRSTDKV